MEAKWDQIVFLPRPTTTAATEEQLKRNSHTRLEMTSIGNEMNWAISNFDHLYDTHTLEGCQA